MTEHPKNETEWSDDDHMERIFAAWVQSRPADAAATEATSTEATGTDAPSPEPPAAGAMSADPATEDVVTGERSINGGPVVDEVSGDEPAFPKSLAKKTSLPDWFVDEPSPPQPPAGKPAAAFPEPATPEPSTPEPSSPEPSAAVPGPAATPEPSAAVPGPAATPEPSAAFPGPAATPEPSAASPGPAATPRPAADDGTVFPAPWEDDASFPDSSDEEPASPAPEATNKAATSTRWTRTDDDVIPKGGKRRWGRKGR